MTKVNVYASLTFSLGPFYSHLQWKLAKVPFFLFTQELSIEFYICDASEDKRMDFSRVHSTTGRKEKIDGSFSALFSVLVPLAGRREGPAAPAGWLLPVP